MAKIKENAAGEISNYIGSLPDFSKIICTKLRSIILNAAKEIKEDWKWGPNYNCNGMVCGYGAFAKHVKFTFFNGAAMSDKKGLFNHCVDNEFSRSIKFTDIKEINEKLLTAYIKESVAINKSGYKRVIADKTVKVPLDLEAAFAKNKKAKIFFDGLSYGYKKEGIEWIEAAKREVTRKERIIKLVNMHADGLRLNDKYRQEHELRINL